MSSGSGRGRGWLHLEKDLKNPGGVPSTMDSLSYSFSSTQVQRYTKLLQLIEQLDLNDDGILLNRKFIAILQQWELDTNTAADVEESFNYIYTQCRKSLSLSKKLILIISSYSFNTAKIKDVKIRSVFVQNLQHDFENRIQMQALLPDEFRNALYILTQFYHKARLIEGGAGGALRVLAVPSVQYLHMLLDSGIPADLELFTSQLYVNGANLKVQCLEKVDELLLRIRQLLAKNAALTAQARVWLLLALDLAHNKFNMLPPELSNFYQDELGDVAMTNLKSTSGILIIGTSESSDAPSNHHGTVNLLKISPSDSALSISKSSNNLNSRQQHENEPKSANHENAEPVHGKIGRPILGAGARRKKNKDSNTNWRDENRSNATNCEEGDGTDGNAKLYQEQVFWSGKKYSKPSSGAIENDEQSKEYWNVSKHSKGWQHDDRFDNAYD